MISVFLKKIGLTDNEISIYIFLLKNGASMASMISKRLNIKRVTVYASLESLERRNFVGSYKKNNVTYFEASSPEKIKYLCEEKVTESQLLKKEAETVLPLLKKIEDGQLKPIVDIKGKLRFYEGLEAVQRLINETLEEGSKEQLCFGLNKYHTEHLNDEWKKYTKKRVAVNMNVRSIQPDIEEARAYKTRDRYELRTTKLVPNNRFPTESELNIIGDMIAVFSAHGNKPTGIKLYNRDIAKAMRSLFELAWESAELHDKKMEQEKS